MRERGKAYERERERETVYERERVCVREMEWEGNRVWDRGEREREREISPDGRTVGLKIIGMMIIIITTQASSPLHMSQWDTFTN